MRFRVLFELHPASVFGVPEEGVTVLPAGPGQYVGDAFHSRTGIRVGYGVLSQYRSDSEQLSLEFERDDFAVEITDNYAWVSTTQQSALLALSHARSVVSALLERLALTAGRNFTARARLIETYGDADADQEVPAPLELVRVTMYDIESLRTNVIAAVGLLTVADDRLHRALDYLRHAMWLFDQRAGITDPGDRNGELLVSASFLNMWKSVTSVVGDPSVRRDGFQRRYRDFGIEPEYFETKVLRLKELRDDYDIAHYTLDTRALDQVEAEYGEARSIALEVLRRYVQWLQSADEEGM